MASNPTTIDVARAALMPNVRNVFDLAWPMTIKAILLHGVFVIDAYLVPALLVSALRETALAAMGLAGAMQVSS